MIQFNKKKKNGYNVTQTRLESHQSQVTTSEFRIYSQRYRKFLTKIESSKIRYFIMGSNNGFSDGFGKTIRKWSQRQLHVKWKFISIFYSVKVRNIDVMHWTLNRTICNTKYTIDFRYRSFSLFSFSVFHRFQYVIPTKHFNTTNK